MNKKPKMVKVRHSSLEMPDPEVVVKKNMLTKARNKLFNLASPSKQAEEDNHKKTKLSSYFFRHCPNNKENNHVYAQQEMPPRRSALQKQHSVGSYPISIEICEELDDGLPANPITRSRPATVCVDKVSEGRDTAALALERPRKKLSFREPEILSYSQNTLKNQRSKSSKSLTPEVKRKISVCNGSHYTNNNADLDLESQAMRVVRTVGQAFEVCHKLSINAPENDNLDQDEQDTLTQDLLSDRMSDITSDKPKKDFLSECASDKMSLPPDEVNYRDSYSEKAKPPQLDVLPPPPNSKKFPLTSEEAYSSPHSDLQLSGSGSGESSSLPPAGSALSAHHEIQLMREQLEQQSQQTHAALAQLQLAREQLAAEQSARLEAQARTHQLLVHNRELLDHIAALVAHLQGGEKVSQQQTPPHVTMPQQQQQQQQQHTGQGNSYMDLSESGSIDNSPVLQQLGLNPQGLMENRAVTSCLPSSPLRTTFNSSGSIFNFPYAPPQMDNSFDAQLLQRLQALSGYTPPSPYTAYNYTQTMPFLAPAALYGQPLLNNNNYTLQPPPKKLAPSPLMTMRHSCASGSPTAERRVSPGRNSEPRQTPQQYQSQQSLYQYSPKQSQNHLQVQQQQQQKSPRPQGSPQPERKDQQQQQQQQFIKPLSQIGTLTTTDAEGRVRVIVPVPGSSSLSDNAGSMFANLKINDSDCRMLNGPPITRSTSEKVPNRSELMSQVQRTMWARHTTK